MSINSNEVQLVSTLLQSSYTISDLALKMGVSRRHIHNYIANINYYIDQTISVQKGIVTLEISGEQWAQKIREVPLPHYRPLSCERQDYLLDNYLFLGQYKYLEIEKQLGVSRPTLKKDLSDLSLRLQLSGLSIQYGDGGFSIVGTEKKIRHLMMERVNTQIKNIHPNIEYCIATTPLQHHTQKIIAQLLSTLPLKEIHTVLTRISHAFGDQFSAHFIQLMFIYLSVSLYRIHQHFFILQKNNADYLRRTTKFKLVYSHLSLLINEQLEFEHLHLTEYFFSGCAEDNFHEYQLCVEMCTMLFLRFFALSSSQISLLHTQLCHYLPSALYRIKNHVYLQSTRHEGFTELDEYQSTMRAMSHCQHWLPEPLRDEELHQISLFIEQAKQSEIPEKLSLHDLINTLQNHAKEVSYDPLKRALLREYPTLFSDDTLEDYLHPCWFSVADVHLIHHHASLTDIAELGALHLANKLGVRYQKIQQPLSKVVTSFIDYLHIGSNVYLYSAQNASPTQSSALQVVLQPGDVTKQTPPSYYFFLIRNESITSHNILFALHQFKQHKHAYENTVSSNSKNDWVVELFNQNLIVKKSI